jgi:hypothetical protein
MDPIAALKAISTLTNGFIPSFHISFQLNRNVVALIRPKDHRDKTFAKSTTRWRSGRPSLRILSHRDFAWHADDLVDCES